MGSSSRTKDQWRLFQTLLIHQGGWTTVRAHDFKRGLICQLQWGLSISNEFFFNFILVYVVQGVVVDSKTVMKRHWYL
jgi:hypothetical protein